MGLISSLPQPFTDGLRQTISNKALYQSGRGAGFLEAGYYT